MTQKERLVELLWEVEYETVDEIADYLLEHGVLVPPVRVGQTVWRIDHIRTRNGAKKAVPTPHPEMVVRELLVSKFYLSEGLSLFCHRIISGVETTSYEIFNEKDVGRTVFLTREEAEKALKGEQKNEFLYD